MTKRGLARALRARFPDTPTKTLARKLYNDNPAAFKDAEDARDVLTKIDPQEAERPRNPYNLPEPEPENYEPYQITGRKHSRLLLINDIHLPYHDLDAVTTAITWAKKEKIDGTVINGDLLDFYALSRFDKNPNARNFAYELEQGRRFLGVLNKQLKDTPIYFKLGNHEERYEKYLQVKAPELLDVEEFRLERLLRAREYNTKIITDKRIVKLNALNVVHGHEFAAGAIPPVNIARGLFLRGYAGAIQGHNHRSSENAQKTLDNKVIPTWSIGCLCGLTPKYMPINQWNQGAAIVDLDRNGREYEVRNKKIVNGKIY